MNTNNIMEKAQLGNNYANNKKTSNLIKRGSIKNLNPNVLNIMRKRSSNVLKNNNNSEQQNNVSKTSEEQKENEKDDSNKKEIKDENLLKENKKKISIANKKIGSSPFLIKNSSKLAEANLHKNPTAVSRNSSNVSILNYQLDGNIKDYFNKNDYNYFDNDNEIYRLNPLMITSGNVDELINDKNESFKHEKFNKQKDCKVNLPRSISHRNNFDLKIDKEIYNSILKDIHNNLHKERKKEELINTKLDEQKSITSYSDPNKDDISDNSFKLKHEKSRSDIMQDANSFDIKKLKVNSNNYTANINGYAPLVKKTEVKDNNIYNYYEYLDENNKKVVFKTKVLESSELLNKNEEEEQEILCFDSANFNNNDLHVKELTSFKWDNLPAYIDKQEKLAKKQSKAIEPVKKLNFFSVFSNVVKNQIIKKVDSNKMKKAFAIFLVTLIIQLILSRKYFNKKFKFF